MTIYSVTAGEPCPVCGAAHATCGPGSPAVPVDQLLTLPKGSPEVKKYRTTVNGHETTLKLSDADAKEWQGAELTEVKGSDTDANSADSESESKARRAPANKAKA